MACVNLKAHLSLQSRLILLVQFHASRDMLRALRVALGDPGHRLLNLQSEEDLYHDCRRLPISMSNLKMLSS